MCQPKTLHIVRSWGDSAEKEFIKSFFRFIGLLVTDASVDSYAEWNRELEETAQNQVFLRNQGHVDIILNAPVEDSYAFSSGAFRVYTSFRFPEDDKRPLPCKASRSQAEIFQFEQELKFGGHKQLMDKRELKQELLNGLIEQIWWNEEPEQRNTIKEIARRYLGLNLYTTLQLQRGFRILCMNEVAQALPDVLPIYPSPFVTKLLSTLWRAYNELSHLNDSCIYQIYACVNSARHIRSLCGYLHYPPDSSEAGYTDANGVMVPFRIPELDELMSPLNRVLEIDRNYLPAYLLAANLYRTQPGPVAAAAVRDYYAFVLDNAPEKARCYTFVEQQLGSYCEKNAKDDLTAKQHYQRCCDRNPFAYQAVFKLACYAAKEGRGFEAQRLFFRVIDIIFNGHDIGYDSSGRYINWEQLSLKQLQYIYKCYIWLAKLAYNRQGGDANPSDCISKACLAATMFQYNLLVKKSVDYSHEESNDVQQVTSYWYSQSQESLSGSSEDYIGREKKLYNQQEWWQSKRDHEISEPLHALWAVLGEWIDGPVRDDFLSNIIHEKLNEFS